MNDLKQAAQQEGALVSRLMMSPDHSGQAAIVVEGDKDHQVFRRFLFPDKSGVLVDAGGRVRAIRVAKTVSKQGIPVLAIVDSDNDLARKQNNRFEGPVFRTDRRDMEATMFLSRAGDSLISVVLDPDEVRRLEAISGTTVKNLLVEACAFIGALRAVNEFENLHIRLRDENPAKYLDTSSLTLDENEYLNAVLAQSTTSESPESLGYKVREVMERVSHADLVPGHDLTAMLEATCRGRLGGPGNHDVESLEMALRVAYSIDEFRETQLYRDLRSWGDEKGLPICA